MSVFFQSSKEWHKLWDFVYFFLVIPLIGVLKFRLGNECISRVVPCKGCSDLPKTQAKINAYDYGINKQERSQQGPGFWSSEGLLKSPTKRGTLQSGLWTRFLDAISDHLSLALWDRVCDTIWHQITCRSQIRDSSPFPLPLPCDALKNIPPHPSYGRRLPLPLPFASRTPRRTRSPIWSQQSQKRRTERERSANSLVLLHWEESSTCNEN